jgi:cell division protein ZapB
MSFEVFEKLEAKVQQAVDTITLLKMEIDELKEKNNALAQEVEAKGQEVASSVAGHQQLVQENQKLKEEQHVWQERLRMLLGKMDDVQ